MWTKFKHWWNAEGAVIQLRGLDDRLLADMGLERAGLSERVHGTADKHSPATTPSRATYCDCTRKPA